MKIFTYSYHIPYGSGAGVVIAESEIEAHKIIYEKLNVGTLDELETTEVDISKPQLIDMSWSE
jgi:hypothetical protein